MRRSLSLAAALAIFSLATPDFAVAQVTGVVPSRPTLGMTWSGAANGVVTISAVEPDSPAAKVGIKTGDVITSVDETRIIQAADLDTALRDIKPGAKANLTILRLNKPIRVTLTAPDNKIGLFGAMLQLDARGRVTIKEVSPNSPAANAGLKPDDVLVSVQGKVPDSVEGLMESTTRLVATLKPGEPVAFKFARGGEEQTALVELPPRATGPGGPVQPVNRAVVLGIAVKERGTQVIVTQIIEAGPASKAGMRPGDIIVGVGEQPVNSYATLVSAIKSAQVGDKVPMQILRGSQRGTMIAMPINNDTSISDVVLDSTDDVIDIVTEVKQLKARVNELTAVVEELTREVQALRKR